MEPWIIVYIVVGVLFLPCLILGEVFQLKVKTTFDKYSKFASTCGITAEELAKIMLNRANITDVAVVEINGRLTDCYDSKHKVVKLSSATFHLTSIAALSVCAHEVGHAIQDNKKMFLFRLRAFLVPVLNFISRMFIPLVLVGSILSFLLYLPEAGLYITWASVGLYGASLLFHLCTLPLEFDASRKAIKMMTDSQMFNRDELDSSKDMLKAAIMTYVSATTVSMLYFLRFLSYAMIFASKNRD